MLYSFKGAYPTLLPHRIVLSNGHTRTDNTTFTEEEIADAGYIAVDNPPAVSMPNNLGWNSDLMEWNVTAPNDIQTATKKAQLIDLCIKELSTTDYKVIKALELNTTIDPAMSLYRQQLRDLYNDIVAGADVWAVQIPLLPTEGQ